MMSTMRPPTAEASCPRLRFNSMLNKYMCVRCVVVKAFNFILNCLFVLLSLNRFKIIYER